jgi:uncharacterized protein with LGFP repeats
METSQSEGEECMGFSKALQTGSSLAIFNTSIDLNSPIGLKWTAIGGEETTGRALGSPIPLDDGIGVMQLFTLGAIFWSPGFGSVYMSERVWRKWSSPSVEKLTTSSGETVQQYLGYPTEDSQRHDTGSSVVEWMYLERGMIYVGPEGSSVVYGTIYGHYRVLGGLDSFLGAPITDERAARGSGRVSHFVHGDIYQHNRTGAHEVHGAIRDRYLDLGGPASGLGYPTSDEDFTQGSHGVLGRFNRFENNAGIYYSDATGAWEVYGAIAVTWQSSGGTAGKLGLPTSGEADTPSSGGRFNEFQGGIIVWHGSGPFVGTYEITDLQLVIAEYTVQDSFNVQVHITATPNQDNAGRMPPDGEFEAGTKTFTPPLIMVTIDLVRANSVISVWLLAISERDTPFVKDAREGTITATYSIDNLWGLFDIPRKHDGSFDAVFRVEPKTQQLTTNADQLFWPFKNTSTFKLSWDTFARTFRDVVESDKHLSFNLLDLSVHPWEIFLYEAVYNNLAQGGSCFGMCLEAVYARNQMAVLIEPIASNPFNAYERNHPLGNTATQLDPNVPGDNFTLDEINVKHGFQIGAGMVEFFLGRWTAGALRDPERAYRESFADFQAGNWPLLTISDQDEFSQDHGHALLPYEWQPTPDRIGATPPEQPLIIYVKNPNYPTAPRDDKHCRIEIDRRTWHWKFQFDDTQLWTGSGDDGGRLLAIPFTELNSRPVTPGYGVLALLASAVIVIFGGDGETEQITDGYGRTFFQYTGERLRLAHSLDGLAKKQINWNKDTRIPSLINPPMFGHTQDFAQVFDENADLRRVPAAPEIYYHRPGPPPKRAASEFAQETPRFTGGTSQARPGAAGEALASAPADILHYQMRGKSHGQMRWTAISPRMSVAVTANTEPDVVDSIHLAGAGGHFQNITINFPNATVQRSVSVAISGWRGEDRQETRSFILEGLSLNSRDTLRAQISDGGRELVLENHGSDKTFNLRLVTGLHAEAVTARVNLPLEASSILRLRPMSWAPAGLASVSISMEILDSASNKVLKRTVI